jgi:hypothetical protein
VDIQPGRDGGYELVTTVGGETYRQEVSWLADKRLLVAAGTANTIDNPIGLAHAMDHCDADGDEAGQLEHLKQYGQLLFQAAFGEDTWQAILRFAAERSEKHQEEAERGEEYLEVAVQGSADDDHAALQALRWEALHDGTRFIAAQGTTDAAIPVAVIRLIKPAAATAFQQIEHIPRILFAVGSYLGDRAIRPGPEFMGIMRGLERSGVQARVLHRATRADLQEQLRTFKPDVLHLIGHGKWIWDEVKVQLRSGPGDESSWISVGELLGIFELARHRPAMVLLSACHTADAGARDPGESPVSALPFAARLVAGNGVAGGVPVVVAMAGDISDTACRVFTRALAAAIGEGKPLAAAVVAGRRATFFGGPGAAARHPVPGSGHWVMPALFLAEGVSGNTRLVNTARTQAAQERVAALDMNEGPIFCGRADFIDALDQLLDPKHALNVLGARAPGADFGGLRLLRELGARAVRSGVLPVLLGPFEGPAFSPEHLAGLAAKFQNCLDEMRASVLGRKELPRTRTLDVAASGSPEDVASAIREDLATLIEELDDDDPVRRRPEGYPRTILLCHRIDQWGACKDLVSMLSPKGLRRGDTPVPVVFTFAGSGLEDEERAWSGKPWIEVLPLGRLSKDRDQAGQEVDEASRGEDVLAYLWWLLNPERESERVYALSRNPRPAWPEIMRFALEEAPIFPRERLRGLAIAMHDSFKYDYDDELLATYANHGLSFARYASAR